MVVLSSATHFVFVVVLAHFLAHSLTRSLTHTAGIPHDPNDLDFLLQLDLHGDDESTASMPQFSADVVTGGGPGRQGAGPTLNEQRTPVPSDDVLNVAGGGRSFGGGSLSSRSDKKNPKMTSFTVSPPGVNSMDRHYQAPGKVQDQKQRQ